MKKLWPYLLPLAAVPFLLLANPGTATSVFGGGGAGVGPNTVIQAAAPAIGSSTAVTWGDTQQTASGVPKALFPTTAVARQLILYSPASNTNDISFGPTINCRFTLIPGQSYHVPEIAGAKFTWSDWFFNATAGQVIVVMYAN